MIRIEEDWLDRMLDLARATRQASDQMTRHLKDCQTEDCDDENDEEDDYEEETMRGSRERRRDTSGERRGRYRRQSRY